MTQPLVEELKRRGELDDAALQAVFHSPALRGRLFAVRLFQSGLVPAELMFDALVQLGARDATDQLQPLPPPRVLAMVPSRLAEDGCMVPFLRTGKRLHVAMLDPSDERAIEDLALFTGFAVEPFVARASELFRVRYEAYGIPPPTPLARFSVDGALDSSLLPAPPREVMPAVATRAATPSSTQPLMEITPAPGPFEEQVITGIFGARNESPLERSLASAELTPAPAPEPEPDLTPLPTEPALEALVDQRRSPAEVDIAAERVPGWSGLAPLPSTAPGWKRGAPPDQIVHERDSAAEQVFPSLRSVFSRAALFLLRGDVAVGWDGCGQGVSRERVRDVLIPLTPASSLRTAVSGGTVVIDDPDQAEAIDHILHTFLGGAAPRSWMVSPLLAGGYVVGLLYVDSAVELISPERQDLARAVANNLGRSLKVLLKRHGRLL